MLRSQSFAAFGLKIGYLILFFFIGTLVTGLLSGGIMMIPGISSTDRVHAFHITAAIQSIFVLLLPAYLAVAVTEKHPKQYLKIGRDEKIVSKCLFALLIFLCSYVLSSFLVSWNKGMKLPEAWHGVEQWMRSMEDAAMEITEMLLAGRSVVDLMTNLLILGLFAAVSEEFFFRGALQQFIHEKVRNDHLSVWITALIFSAIHFQFFGFLPRLLLGALLGYLFLYTRNLWSAIFFHFINNASVVLLSFFWGDSDWMQQMEALPITLPFAVAALAGGVITFLLFRTYRKRTASVSMSHHPQPDERVKIEENDSNRRDTDIR